MASHDPFGYGTHEVLNQAPAMADYDAYGHDPALAKILSAFNADWAAPHARLVGKRVASARVQKLARQANRNLPELRTHDRWGRRIDQIEFHPAWHELMTLAMRDEFHSLCWTKPRPGAQVARAAVSYLWNQGVPGSFQADDQTHSFQTQCPTYGPRSALPFPGDAFTSDQSGFLPQVPKC